MDKRIHDLVGKKVSITGNFPVVITGTLKWDGFLYSVTVKAGESYANFDRYQCRGLSDYSVIGYPTIVVL